MKTPISKTIFILSVFLISFNSFSQNIKKDSINDLINNAPSFTIFQDNYFITGTSLDNPVSRSRSDAKYQISFKQRLTKATLPFNTYLFLTYTQKSFWKIYEESKPFAETNYNPALGIGKFFTNKDDLLRIIAVAFEHESNGKDSIYSRTWNRISFQYMQQLTKMSSITVKGWIPFAYREDNPDLIKYVGYGEISYSQKIYNGRYVFDITSRKGMSWDDKGSVSAQISYRISKRNNQYLSLQYYTGYAESLIDYDQKTNMIRVGFVIKPSKVFY